MICTYDEEKTIIMEGKKYIIKTTQIIMTEKEMEEIKKRKVEKV